jgi:translocator protein
MNWFATILTGNSLTDISAETVLAIRPAPYTFAIWGVIYSLLLIFVIY